MLDCYNDNVNMCKHTTDYQDQNGIKQSKITILKLYLLKEDILTRHNIEIKLTFYIILSV